MNKPSTSRAGLLAIVILAMTGATSAQTTAPPTNNIPDVASVKPLVEPAAAPAINAATTLARDPLSNAIAVRPRPGPVTLVGTGSSVSESVRVLRGPGSCTPKTNSLDCVQDSSQAGQGANVSGRVRSGVIGEVGTGRGTTEGKGGAQRKEACTPKPGELTCTP
jgi:hypothetical protein